jgi:hypothetical protein
MVPPPVTRVPPIPAGVAVVCALLGALPVAVFSFIAGAFSAASQVWSGLVLGAVPAVVAVVVLAGRSWRVLLVGSVLTLVLVVVALTRGAAADDTTSVVVLVAGPLLAAVLGSRPVVRSWVAARQAARG